MGFTPDVIFSFILFITNVKFPECNIVSTFIFKSGCNWREVTDAKNRSMNFYLPMEKWLKKRKS